MDRQYGHVIGNPTDYSGIEYGPQQMMYSVGPGQQVVGPPLVPPNIGLGGVIQGGPQPMMGVPGLPMMPSNNPPSQPGVNREGPGGGGDLLEDLLGPFPVVRLRGLPFEAQIRDVILFFQGIGVLDVVLLQRGEAIVVFNTVMDCQMALARDRQNMGRRYIEVFQAKRFDYYNAIAQTWAGEGGGGDGRGGGSGGPISRPSHGGSGGNPGGYNHNRGGGGSGGAGGGGSDSSVVSERAANSGVLKLRGLPFSANKSDVQQFFDGFNLRPDGVHFVYRSDGRLTGEAFVTFANAEEARTAHRTKDRSLIGSRYVEIFPSTLEECSRLTGGNKAG